MMAGKERIPGSDPNEDLVKALESIKGLLEKSESKLSAARSSIEKARTASGLPANSDDDKVPMLEDIVVLKKEFSSLAQEIAPTPGTNELKDQIRAELLDILREEMGKLENRLLQHLERRLTQIKK